MRVDEAATYLYYVRKPPLYGLVSYTLPNNHVFHTLLVSASTFVFGNHPWAIRLPAFGAGVAMIPLAFVVGRQEDGEAAGLLAAAFVATSSVLIEYSTDARGYTMVAALFLALLALQPALLRAEPRAWRWFTILSALGFFTVPTFLFPFGIVVVFLAVKGVPWRRLARSVGLALLVTALAYFPAFLWTGPHVFVSNRFVVSRPWTVWLSLIRRSVIDPTWLGWNRGLGLAGMLLFAAFFVAGLVRDKTRLPLITVAWCALLVIAARWIVFPRVWTFLIPLYWMTVAAGIVWVFRQRWAIPIALAALVAIGGSVLVSGSVVRACDGCFPDAERVAVALDGIGARTAVLAFNPATAPLQYYAVLHRERLRINTLRATDQRVFIVVDTAAGQAPADVVRGHSLTAREVARATVFERFAGATVYVYAR
ncbi:MAG TPA: glycosyltransferase family 39 protein [Actinomycetota bacterium]|nr:glycosyltransferase family 39 protein [Actinomycetota bacterium]